nr:11-beta-hydroxysteroid dehydrogenase 1B-like [Tanacetum cinerariifolium]
NDRSSLNQSCNQLHKTKFRKCLRSSDDVDIVVMYMIAMMMMMFNDVFDDEFKVLNFDFVSGEDESNWAKMSIVPMELAAKSAVAIVDGASRRDLYLVVPRWVQTIIYWVPFFPEMVDWLNHWFLLVEPRASPLYAPSKMLLDVPGLRHIVQPDSVISFKIQEYDYKLVVHMPHK